MRKSRSDPLIVLALAAAAACGPTSRDDAGPSLDAAARSYVGLVLALGERDADSLDAYHGPAAWQAEARSQHATLPDIRARAGALADSLVAHTPDGRDDDRPRRAFLVGQLRAVASRIDLLQGARPSFDDEARLLFGLDTRDDRDGRHDERGGAAPRDPNDVRAELDRLLPGRGDLPSRYAAFDRQFLIAPDRVSAVLARAIDGCRAATRAHVALPDNERVRVELVRDRPWSAFTRYEGGFASRVEVNVALPLTVDRALDLACHEAYPGHHTIDVLLESRFGGRRPEFLVQPLFSPQSLLHEAAASLAPALAFPDANRLAFERDALFPLAGLDPSRAEHYVAIARRVDQLHAVAGAVARQYLDGALDFPRAAAALERDALMPSADATLKFVNQFRSYAATYTIGRDCLAPVVAGGWDAYVRAVADPRQALPPRRAGT